MRFAPLVLAGLAACWTGLGVWRGESLASDEAGCGVSYVYDGDTVEMTCGEEVFRARLVGFDTPETRRAKCPAEADHGARATRRLRALLREADSISTIAQGTDRYGRRLLRMQLDGRDLARQMISEGLAVAYSGGRRIDWCARLAG